MNRRHRLTDSRDFKRVRRTGKSYAHPLAVLVASPSDRGTTRFGVTTARGFGGAVQRNRARRRLREALRSLRGNVSAGWDVVLIARPAALEADGATLLKALEDLFRRSALMN